MVITWSGNCVLTDLETQSAVPALGDNPERSAINAPTVATITITDTKLYVPAVTFSTHNDSK